jgi:hypothetical protein
LASVPDVCLTPAPNGQVPIPYPNIAFSRDLAKGSRTVKCDGLSTTLKDSVFSKSIGDEPGTGGGVVSGVNRGKAKFVNYSFDVKFEGRNVVRRLDPTLNNGNAYNSLTAAAKNKFLPHGPVVMGAVNRICQEYCKQKAKLMKNAKKGKKPKLPRGREITKALKKDPLLKKLGIKVEKRVYVRVVKGFAGRTGRKYISNRLYQRLMKKGTITGGRILGKRAVAGGANFNPYVQGGLVAWDIVDVASLTVDVGGAILNHLRSEVVYGVPDFMVGNNELAIDLKVEDNWTKGQKDLYTAAAEGNEAQQLKAKVHCNC